MPINKIIAIMDDTTPINIGEQEVELSAVLSSMNNIDMWNVVNFDRDFRMQLIKMKKIAFYFHLNQNQILRMKQENILFCFLSCLSGFFALIFIISAFSLLVDESIDSMDLKKFDNGSYAAQYKKSELEDIADMVSF